MERTQQSHIKAQVTTSEIICESGYITGRVFEGDLVFPSTIGAGGRIQQGVPGNAIESDKKRHDN